MEIWKPIKGYENLYEVSNLGRVKSLKTNKILKNRNCYGYDRCCLTKDKKSKNFFTHRLVAETFIPNPNNFPIINHKDCNRSNNRVENLEWCNQSYNSLYAFKMGTRKPVMLGRKDALSPFSKAILQYSKNGEFIKEWNSIRECARTLNIAEASISACCSKKKSRKTAYGYIWRYKESDVLC